MKTLFRMAASGCPNALRNDLASLQDFVCFLKSNRSITTIIQDLGEPAVLFFLAEHGTCGIRKLDTSWAEYIKSAPSVSLRVAPSNVDNEMEEILSNAYEQTPEKCVQYQRVRSHLLSLRPLLGLER